MNLPNRKLFKTVVIIFLAMCSVTSCYTPQISYIELDLLSPAERTFPSEIVNLVVVDNTKEFVVIEDSFLGKNEIPLIDSSAARLVEILKDTLNNYNYFNEISVHPLRTRENDQDDGVKFIPDEQISQICMESDADALLSIDQHDMRGRIYRVNAASPYYVIEIDTRCQASLFSSSAELLPPVISERDTFYLRIYNWKNPSLPTYESISKKASNLVAKKMVEKWFPAIETQVRHFYSAYSLKAERGVSSAYKGDWASAESVWVAAFEKENNIKKKARTAHNIALANECLDNIDKALEWIDIAIEEAKTVHDPHLLKEVRDYKKVLEKRLEDSSELRFQLGI